jgi:type 1 fimbria pilin
MYKWPKLASGSSAYCNPHYLRNNCNISARRHARSLYSRYAIRAAVILWIVFCMTPARALVTCTYPVNVKKVLDGGTISIPVSSPVGATVKTLPPNAFQVPCKLNSIEPVVTSGVQYTNFQTTALPVAGFTDVYATNVPGLGVRFAFNAPACDAVNATLVNGLVKLTCPISTPVDGPFVNLELTAVVSLVTTGTIAPGAASLLTIPEVTMFYQHSTSGDYKHQYGAVYTGAANGTLSTATCSVQTDGPLIPLSPVTVRELSSGLGTTAKPEPFELRFACASGATVSIVITDAVEPSNRSNTLTLTPDSTARGVGVQVLKDNGTPVAFGPDAAGPGVANQWLIGASPNGLLVLPLSAQYIRTGNVVPGKIRALATFTMSYQ